MREAKWRLTPIHPFTDRQADTIRAAIRVGPDRNKIGRVLRISPNTVGHLISGMSTGETRKSARGILGVIESITGIRPARLTDAIDQMKGDVLLPTRTTRNKRS